MDERRYQRAPSFLKLAAEFEMLADRLAEIPLEELRPYRAAAE
jgi:N-formylglutamate deformylase